MRKYVTLALALTAAVASPAFAGTTIFTGDTTGGAVFNRPLTGAPPTALSGVGTAVRYIVTPFTVSLSGSYNLLNTAAGHDSFLGLHRIAFNPASPLTNALAYDDDAGPGTDSLISAISLLAGVSYFAVSTGFANDDFGAFRLTIDGPGNIIGGGGGGGGVPEPATWAMMIFGFAGIGAALRRRRNVGVTVTA